MIFENAIEEYKEFMEYLDQFNTNLSECQLSKILKMFDESIKEMEVNKRYNEEIIFQEMFEKYINYE